MSEQLRIKRKRARGKARHGRIKARKWLLKRQAIKRKNGPVAKSVTEPMKKAFYNRDYFEVSCPYCFRAEIPIADKGILRCPGCRTQFEVI
jgi:hypothetical protein